MYCGNCDTNDYCPILKIHKYSLLNSISWVNCDTNKLSLNYMSTFHRKEKQNNYTYFKVTNMTL